MEVLTAASGEDAIQKFDENQATVRAILLDITMPGLGGVRTYNELRRRGVDVPIVLMSGYS